MGNARPTVPLQPQHTVWRAAQVQWLPMPRPNQVCHESDLQTQIQTQSMKAVSLTNMSAMVPAGHIVQDPRNEPPATVDQQSNKC